MPLRPPELAGEGAEPRRGRHPAPLPLPPGQRKGVRASQARAPDRPPPAAQHSLPKGAVEGAATPAPAAWDQGKHLKAACGGQAPQNLLLSVQLRPASQTPRCLGGDRHQQHRQNPLHGFSATEAAGGSTSGSLRRHLWPGSFRWFFFFFFSLVCVLGMRSGVDPWLSRDSRSSAPAVSAGRHSLRVDVRTCPARRPASAPAWGPLLTGLRQAVTVRSLCAKTLGRLNLAAT